MRSPLARDAHPSLEESERLDASLAPGDPPIWLTPPPTSIARAEPSSSDFTARVMARIQTESQPEATGARANARAANTRGLCRRGSRSRALLGAFLLTFGPALLLALVFPGLAFAVAGTLLALLLSGLVGMRAAAHALNQLTTNPAVLLGLALGCGATAFGCAFRARHISRHIYRPPRKR